MITIQYSEAPVLANIPVDVTIECDQPLPTDEPTATDNCDNNVNITLVDTEVPGACPQEKVITRTRLQQMCLWEMQVLPNSITIRDKKKPYWQIFVDVTIECDQPLPTDEPTATDNCDNNVSISLVDNEVPGACPQERVVTRTWTATDACGNASTASQVITIQDSEAPVMANIPFDVTIECDQPLPTDEPTATDNCDPNVTITFVDAQLPGACANELVITRTWTATDACGNASTASSTITLQDSEAPVLANVPSDVTIECDQPLPTDEPVSLPIQL
ncbi:MAG: hypothetical protein R2784_14110 [Saprospiraceae bacterium]